jgi:hypothetical protein
VHPLGLDGHLGAVALRRPVASTEPNKELCRAHRRLGHDHDSVGVSAHSFQHEPLVRGRVAQDGVGHHHDRRVDGIDQLDQRLAVGSVVQAVLVLHDDELIAVQRIDRN